MVTKLTRLASFPTFNAFLFVLLTTFAANAQCPSGAVGIVGGGCMSGCNLTSLGGPNCVPPVTGNTTTQTVFTNITVPAGCTFTVTAVMSNRAGACTASGADAGDGMKVDIPGGPKPLLAGASNGTLNDSYVLVGPGTIRVTCVANRQDEIVTYSVTSSGALCTACMSILPVELAAFQAIEAADYVDLVWTTLSERDSDFFLIERSVDGKLFEAIGTMPAAGNSASAIQYTSRDNNPLQGTSYYRLKQTDLNGEFSYSEIRAVTFDAVIGLFPNPANEELVLTAKNLEDAVITLTDAMGQVVELPMTRKASQAIIEVRGLPNGIYFVSVLMDDQLTVEKVVVRH